jgi:hypothetical protein
MAEVRTVVCDLCGGSDAERWAITKRHLKPWVIDLCDQCAQPLAAMRERGRAGDGGARPYRRLRKTPVKAL